MTKNRETFPQLETERLLLRELVEEDAHVIHRYFSDKKVTKFYGLTTFTSIEQAERTVAYMQSLYKDKKGIRWGIVRKDTGQLIGTCGFHNVSLSYKRCEVGCEISRANWGKGYGTEALKHIFAHAFKTYLRIGAVVITGNAASNRLVEKLGFTKEGLLRHYIIQDNQPKDAYMYSILKEEFQQ